MSETPTTQGPPAATPPPPRRLLRSPDDRVLGGVCGGLARYFDVDPLLVRIVAAALVFVGGFALVAYLGALLFVPLDDGTGAPVPGGRGATVARMARGALVLGAILLGAVLLAAGAAVATAAGGGTAVAAAVIVLGVLMVGLSFKDRRARWLALPALLLAIPSGVVAAAGVDVDHGVGDRHYAPVSALDLEPYELGVGELEVDLRRMDWSTTTPVRVKVDVGTGHALVLVPRDVCVEADTRAGLGWIDVLGDGNGGADVDDVRGTVARSTGKRLLLDAHVGIGAVEVRHTPVRGDWEDRHRDGGDVRISDRLADAGCAGARA